MKSSKSSLFLMELILSILFFALASTACVQLFVKAHLLGIETEEENHALLLCQNLSEIYLGTISEDNAADPELLQENMLLLMKGDESLAGVQSSPGSTEDLSAEDGFTLLLCYDSEWQHCNIEQSCYQVIFNYEGYDTDKDVYAACVTACRNDEEKEIYHLDVSKHIPREMK
ncbi:MAG: hypothetical protein ACI4C4_10190 [Lachnospiraceae bacterium]